LTSATAIALVEEKERRKSKQRNREGRKEVT